MIAKELTFTLGYDSRPDHEDDIARYLRNIAAERHALDLLAIDAAYIDEMRTTVNNLADHVTLGIASHNQLGALYTDILLAMRRHAGDWRNWASSVDTTLQSRRSQSNRNITTYEERLTNARMALARCRPPRSVHVNASAFRKDLARHVNAKNTRLHNRSGTPSIEAVFDDIVLTPVMTQKLPPWIKVLNGGAPCVRIPPVKVVLYPVSRNVALKCLRSGTLSSAGYINGFTGTYVAHPHVTSRNGAPCLGDWGGPLMEALDAGDYILSFDIIKQFLRSASDDDPAGRTWRRYIDADAHYQWNSSTPPRDHDSATNTWKYAYFLLDGKGGVTKLLHDDPNNWPNIQVIDLAPPPALIVADLPEDVDTPEADDADLNVYDADGYDENGYDREGYDHDGIDRDGYDENGYNEDGYDREGYNENGYNEDGYNRDGYDRDGYDENGIDHEGYDRDGYDHEGFNRQDRDRNDNYRWAQHEYTEAVA